jgi:hypothetical protein
METTMPLLAQIQELARRLQAPISPQFLKALSHLSQTVYRKLTWLFYTRQEKTHRLLVTNAFSSILFVTQTPKITFTAP